MGVIIIVLLYSFFFVRFLTNDWIVNTVYEYYLKNDVNGACIRLVEEATLAWEREDEVIDDITCMIAFIGQNLSNEC